MKTEAEACKICHSRALEVFSHTARCRECGVLLLYPYPEGATENHTIDYREWHKRVVRRNHFNLTSMFLFAIPHPEAIESEIKILDYGAGPGQFATICKSFIPWSRVYSVDVNDYGLFDEYHSLTHPLRWNDFERDETTFDYIFLNDVFEHVYDCQGTLGLLVKKLKPHGKLFIDTTKQFWLYPVLRFLSKRLYGKLLNISVSIDHLQMWSRKSFFHIITQSGLRMEKYLEFGEFKMEPDIYFKNMDIRNRFLILLGRLFYRHAKLVAKNKIMCLLVKE